ncbi:MAG: heavy metal-binding domain-containing protein [Candidatus Thermoplasmatota archaeon]|nr:heavy metal-binding domain-containing protein [Candidatus Thermoplasmatota archaeon]MCL6091160.1 heavy metal-binding domain-containing protein [Candidatus Thermoplasmatota archaeon]
MNQVIVVSTNYVPGHRIKEVIGTIWGITVRSRGIGGNIMAGLRTIAGGEIKEYVKMLNDARNLAMERLREEAEKAGANAVIEMRFDTSEIAQIMTEIVAYGTAVKVEKLSESGQAVSLS